MGSLSLIPHPDAITVHWGWFHVLLMVTFVMHLLLMNTMLGSSIIALLTELGGTNRKVRIKKEIAVNLPYSIAFAVNFGVAPLLFVQVLYGQFIYTSSVLMASYWLSIIAMLIIAYYCAYIYDFKFDTLESCRTVFIALTTILLLVIGFLFSNNMTLMLRPEAWTRYFTNASGTLLNLTDATLFPRYLHFVVASVAVGGLFQALRASLRRNDTRESIQRDMAAGLRWFSIATFIQLLVGLWFFLALPAEIRQIFIGASSYATILLALGLSGAVLSLIFGIIGRLWPTIGATMATIVVMVLIRDALRTAFLAPYFSLSSLKVNPQYSPLIVFLIVFVVGIAVIVYMLKLAVTAGRKV